MAANGITDVEADTLLDLSIPASSTVDLVTTMGTATAAPTKLTGGTYAAQTPTWAAASARSKANSAIVTFSGLPDTTTTTVKGIDITRPSAGARSWFMPFATPIGASAGSSITFAVSAITASFANGT